MKFIETLGKRHLIGKFHWNFFATGHGQGIADGIGGEAKSLVRQQVLSKTLLFNVFRILPKFAKI